MYLKFEIIQEIKDTRPTHLRKSYRICYHWYDVNNIFKGYLENETI